MNNNRKWLIALAAITILTDALLNASRAHTFAEGVGFYYWISVTGLTLGAAVLAVAPCVISTQNDQRALNAAFMISMLSALLSVASILSMRAEHASSTNAAFLDRQRIEKQLVNHEQKIAACRADQYCNSQKMRDHYSKLQDTLDSLPKVSAAIDKQSIEYRAISLALVLMALSLPFIASEIGRQIGINRKTKVPELPKKTVPEPSSGSTTRNRTVPELPRLEPILKKPEPEPKKLEPIKPKIDIERTKFAQKLEDVKDTGRVPNKQQELRLLQAWRSFERDGIKPTVAELAKVAGVNKAKACWWSKFGDKKGKAKMEVVKKDPIVKNEEL